MGFRMGVSEVTGVVCNAVMGATSQHPHSESQFHKINHDSQKKDNIIIVTGTLPYLNLYHFMCHLSTTKCNTLLASKQMMFEYISQNESEYHHEVNTRWTKSHN